MKEKSGESMEEDRHPLLIDVVLEVILKLVPRSAVPNCRLVCKKWNYFLQGRFGSEFKVKLTEWKSMEKFVELLNSSESNPYRCFHICRISLNNPWLENVFELCGPSMQHLTLELTKDDIDICQFRELLLYRAPNLKELSFDTHDGLPEEVTNHPKLFPAWCQSSSSGSPPPQLKLEKLNLRFSSRKKFHVNFLKQLFQGSPLEELHFRRLTDSGGDDSETQSVLVALKETGPWQSLTSLSLGQIENLSLLTLATLKENGIRLKSFSFEHLTTDVKDESVEHFLETQAENLEELVLNEYFGTQHLRIKFPIMRHLRKLSITAFDKSQILPNNPFCYVEIFPVLEALAVYGWQNMIPWDILFSEKDNATPLECLTTLQPPYRLNDVELLKTLVRLFPNISSLDITSPSNQILTELWDSWSSLKVLDLFLDWNNTNIDSVFTGINVMDCDRLRKNRTLSDAKDLSLKENISICNLRELRKFVCEIYEPWRDGEPEAEDPTCLLTDISGYGALLLMPHLQHISIARSEISPECLKEITRELPLYTSIDIRGPRRQKLIWNF